MSYISNLLTEKIGLTRVLLTAVLVITAFSILVTGCGKQGVLTPINKPAVFITSYEGQEDPANLADPYFFQKKIYWRGESSRGVITGFAYRVLKDDGVSVVQTPKTHIDPSGWIYHYKPGADQSIPLTGHENSPDVRTIWTKRVFDVIHFPATIEGDSTIVTSVFEIKCKDNYDQESDSITRYFNAVSFVPDVDIIFSDRFRPLAAAADPENPVFRTVGLGIEVEFEITENTPYTTPANVPNYYMFRIERRNITTGALLYRYPETEGSWLDTRGQRNTRRIWLAQHDDNPNDFSGRDDVKFILQPDEFNNNNYLSPVTETFLYFKAVNMANVHSQTKHAKFRVFPNFRPQALVYSERTNVLGRNHFTTYQDASLSRPLPEAATPEGIQFGTPFFITKAGKLSAIWSDDIKIYLRWGWRGQYADDDPDKGFINEVHDTITGTDYLSTVKAFDLRLGDIPYPYPPLINHPEYETKFLYKDQDGTEWLRVPRYHEIDTRALLTSIAPGEYAFSLRIVDSQNRTSEVEIFNFLIAEKVPREQKRGILVIANETFPSLQGVPIFKAYTTDFYQQLLDESGIERVDVIDRQEMRTLYEPLGMHHGRIFLSTADMEPYRLVIWHSDNPTMFGTDDANVHHEYEVVNLYLRGGGNMLISAGSNLNTMKNAAESQGFFNIVFHRFFGLTYRVEGITNILSTTYFGPAARPYLTGGTPAAGVPINIADINIDWTHPYLARLQASQNIQGLGPVTFFNPELILDPNTKPFYTMKVTEAGADFENVPVAIRRKTDNNTTYAFGFPLSFMQREEVLDMIKKIYQELGAN